MLDAAMLTLVVVCFMLARSYAKLCDRLLALSADNDVAA